MELLLLTLVLLLPDLLRMSQGRYLPVEFKSPLPQVILLQRQFPLALRNFSQSRIAIGEFAFGIGRRRGRPLLQLFDLPLELVFALLERELALAKPKAGRAQVGFKLCHAGVERCLAAIDLAQPLSQMAGQLCHLQLQLLTAKLEIIARHRGDHLGRRLFNLEQGLASVSGNERVNNLRSQRLLSGSLGLRYWAVLGGRVWWIDPCASRRDKRRWLVRSPCFSVSYCHDSPHHLSAAKRRKLDLIGKLSHVIHRLG